MRSHRIMLLMIVLLATALGSGAQGEEPMQAPGTAKRTVTFEPFDFSEAAKASPAAKGHNLRPVAFSLGSPPRVAATYRVNDGTLGIAVSGARGESVHLFGGHEGKDVQEVSWAPDRSLLVYSVLPTIYSGNLNPPPETSSVWVLIPTGRGRRLLIADGARLPQWGHDANEILFWRQEGRPEDSPLQGAFERPWRLYQATGPWTKPTVAPAAPTLLHRPMDVSPGGQFLAYWIAGPSSARGDQHGIVVRNLDTHTEVVFALPEGDRLGRFRSVIGEAAYWSGDSSWVLLGLTIRGSEVEQQEYRLLNVPQGLFVDLTTRVRRWLTENQPEFRGADGMIQMGAPAWLGTTGHRLLLYAFVPTHEPVSDASPYPGEAAWKWLVYDANQDTLDVVSGLGPAAYVRWARSIASPDGGYAWIGSLKRSGHGPYYFRVH